MNSKNHKSVRNTALLAIVAAAAMTLVGTVGCDLSSDQAAVLAGDNSATAAAIASDGKAGSRMTGVIVMGPRR